jgi:hypothetical protein
MSSWVKVGSEWKLATNIWNDGKPCRRLIFSMAEAPHSTGWAPPISCVFLQLVRAELLGGITCVVSSGRSP